MTKDIITQSEITSVISDLLRSLRHEQEISVDRCATLEAIKQIAIFFDSSVLLDNLYRVETIDDGIEQFLKGKIDLNQLRFLTQVHNIDCNVGEQFIAQLFDQTTITLSYDADEIEDIEETENALTAFFNLFMNEVRNIQESTPIDESGFIKHISPIQYPEGDGRFSEDATTTFTFIEQNPLNRSPNTTLVHAQKALFDALELYTLNPSYNHFRALQLTSVKYAEEIHCADHLAQESIDRMVAALQRSLNSVADLHDNASDAGVATIIMQSRALFGFGRFGEMYNSKVDIRTTSNSLRLTAASLIDLVMIQNLNASLIIEESAIAVEKAKMSLDQFIAIVADNPIISVTDKKSFRHRIGYLKSSFSSGKNSLKWRSFEVYRHQPVPEENVRVGMCDILDSYYLRFSDTVSQYIKKQKRVKNKRR